MTVYLDVVFALNLLMDYTVLSAAARLCSSYVRRWRLLLAAGAGGALAVLMMLWPALNILPAFIAVMALEAFLAFGRGERLLRQTMVTVLAGLSLAGLAAALGAFSGKQVCMGAVYYFMVPLRVLVLAAAGAYTLSGLLLRGELTQGRQLFHVTVAYLGKEHSLSALRDTGNELTEPISGKPAAVLGRKTAERILRLSSGALDGLTSDNAAEYITRLRAAGCGRCGLLPYHAVGSAGLLMYVQPDWVQNDRGQKLECVLAVSPERLSGSGYDMLIGA